MSNASIDKVIKIAKAEIGYKETPVNVTKYAKFFDSLRKDGIKVYNYTKQGAEWCDIFVDWVFYQAFGDMGMKMLYQPMGGCGAGCAFSAGYFRDHKAFKNSPEVGDQIFFGTKGHEKHTGIVTKVTNKKVYTIEGNKNNQVKECSYSLTNSSIAGYGRPNWKTTSGTSETSKPKEDPKKAQGDIYRVTADSGLNLRAGPGTNYTLLLTMPKGSTFTVTETKGDWVKGKYDTHIGWAYKKWLKKV